MSTDKSSKHFFTADWACKIWEEERKHGLIYLFIFIYLLALDHPDAGWTESDGDKEDLANGVVSLLVDKKDMLDDYFSIQIDDQGQMLGIPMLLEG